MFLDRFFRPKPATLAGRALYDAAAAQAGAAVFAQGRQILPEQTHHAGRRLLQARRHRQQGGHPRAPGQQCGPAAAALGLWNQNPIKR